MKKLTALLLTAILLSSCVKPPEDEIVIDKPVDSVLTTETKMKKTTTPESTLNETTTETIGTIETTVAEERIRNLIEDKKTPIPPECIKAYREYFDNFDFELIKSYVSKKYIYIGDINSDGFPEVVIPFIGVLYYYENEIHTLEFLRFPFFSNHFNESTNQFFISGGNSGQGHCMIYDYIDGKYELTYYLRMEKEYLSSGSIEHYYINDLEVDTSVYKNEFEIYDFFNKQELDSRCVLCYDGCINNKFIYDFNDVFSSEYPFETFDDLNGEILMYIEKNLFQTEG